ncbi:MAG TPA: zinc-binding dehydrogenase [Phycisphaerae bacterium]|nr:zinc-binding dehydrogenase [Phycisphaerae bacterium]
MRAWMLPGLMGVESMKVEEVADPVAGEGEVVIAVEFAALNPADRYLAMGQYPARPAFPHVLGRDGIGKVVAVGKGVSGIREGDVRLIMRSEVGVARWGTLAEKVAVEARYTAEVPSGWTHEEAAAAPLVYITAWQALTQWGDGKALSPGTTVLVTGASGGVGVACVQVAHAMGCTVVGLSRSKEKGEKLRGMGADVVLNPEGKGWRKELFAQLGQRPVNVAVDNIGGALFNEVIETLGMWGKVSVVGRLAGPVPEFNTASLFFRRLQIGGVAIGTYTNEESHGAWRSVLETLGKTGAKPVVDRVFGFGEVMGAFERLQEGPMGKVVVRVGA